MVGETTLGEQKSMNAALAGEQLSSGRTLVLVAGSGRSGTSLFTGILQRLGFHVPQPEVPADETNPRGFAESQWVVDFHTRLLTKAAVHVSDARPTAWARAAELTLDSQLGEELRTLGAAEVNLRRELEEASAAVTAAEVEIARIDADVADAARRLESAASIFRSVDSPFTTVRCHVLQSAVAGAYCGRPVGR